MGTKIPRKKETVILTSLTNLFPFFLTIKGSSLSISLSKKRFLPKPRGSQHSPSPSFTSHHWVCTSCSFSGLVSTKIITWITISLPISLYPKFSPCFPLKSKETEAQQNVTVHIWGGLTGISQYLRFTRTHRNTKIPQIPVFNVGRRLLMNYSAHYAHTSLDICSVCPTYFLSSLNRFDLIFFIFKD